MSRHERTGKRDLTFSAWHRTLRDDLTYVDIDKCGYCTRCKDPLYLAEIAYDTGAYKTATVTRNLAIKAGIPALVVLYKTNENGEIIQFRVRKIAPEYGEWITATPRALADWFERHHDAHVCIAAPRLRAA
jgi:hypothetical protein